MENMNGEKKKNSIKFEVILSYTNESSSTVMMKF